MTTTNAPLPLIVDYILQKGNNNIYTIHSISDLGTLKLVCTVQSKEIAMKLIKEFKENL